MQFKRISIRNFRRLQAPLIIGGLLPGLNVIAGDNEEGKSTVLRAIRAALFDKHNLSGQGAEALLPYGAKTRPEVELEFSVGGVDYRLAKGFVQSKSAELSGGGREWSNDAAEEALRELLGFDQGRGASDSSQQGIWGLLWVEQGTAFQEARHGERAQRTLSAALESEVGDVLGGEQGQAIQSAVRAAWARHFTATGRPTGAYKEARDQVESLEAELANLDARLGAYEEKVDALQHARDELAKLERHGELQRRLTALDAARAAQTALQTLRQAVADAEIAQRLALAEQNAPRERWTQRDGFIRRQQALAEQAGGLLQTLERARADKQSADRQLTAHAAEREQADQALIAARKHLAAVDAEARRLQLSHSLAMLGSQIRRAEEAEAAAARADAQAAQIAVDAPALAALRELETQILRAQAQLDAGATQIELEVSVDVTRDGAPVPARGTITVAARTELNLAGVGRLLITPGNKDLAVAAETLSALQRQRHEQLAALGASDLGEAERLLTQRQTLAREADNQRKLAEVHAPDGVAALRAEAAKQEGALARLPAPAAETPVDADSAEAARTAAQEALRLAEITLETASAAARASQANRDTAAAAVTEADLAWRLNNDESTRLAAQLNEARAAESDENLRVALSKAEGAATQAANQLAEAKARLTAAEPERVAAELEMAENALEQHRLRVKQLERRAHELEIELQTLGQQGLGERRQELAAELALAQTRLTHLTREAESLRLLKSVLDEAAQRARESFFKPVLGRIAQHLRHLMPGSELLLDDQLQLQGLRRRGIEEPFKDLSLGTREQLAIVTRLAFADLLAERGQPVTVVLDDALVYADDERFERMKLILKLAAQRYQVLVLTCRERDYASLGVPIVRLAECRVAELAAG